MQNFEISNDYLTRYLGAEKVVTIPDGVVYIGDSAFYGNPDVEEIHMPDTVRHIGRSAFAECYQLKRIHFSANLEVIGDAICESCRSLQEVILPDKVGFIGRLAFAKCNSLKKVRLPMWLGQLKQGLFMGDLNLESIEMPKQLDEIGDSVFYYCKSLEEIELPSYVRLITPNTFYECTKLKRGFIPAMNLEYYPPEEQLMLAMLYLTTKSRYTSWEQQVYDAFIRANVDRMCDKILQAKSYDAIPGMLSLEILTAEDMDRWIKKSRKDGDLEFTAKLLQWKQDRFEEETDMWEI